DAAVKALGAKAIDAKTVEVTLEAPSPYFIALTSFSTLNVVDKKVVEANPDWATKAETYVSAGPYKLTKWEHKKQLDLVKNENYWDAANVKTDKLTFYMVEEQATFLNMYESNQLDVTEQPGASEAPRLLKEGQLKVSPMFGTYFWNFNVTKAPFNNVKVRQALSLAIDRNAIVKNVMRAGQQPANAFVAPGSMDADGKTDYRQVGGDLFKEDVAKAKQLLAEAGYPDGKNFPEATFLYNTSDDHKAIAEAVLEMWKKNLGITSIKMENTEWKVVLDKRQHLDYDIARASWIGDYVDPMTFMDMFVTDGGNNDIGWSNPKYDQLIKEAKSTADQKVRMAKMHEAEKVFMDEMPILPIYYYNNQFLQKENITGVYRSSLGMIDFKWAEVK
ncbi:MAG TPA: peptide ABC transporter substrate-binding protein, partial [Symbiobacteriaceae bacterium]|nr:peptide ABC transporter substrate-binding protein [Symbiobacteriaceae bacterium]